MKTYEINKFFETQEECDKWEEENIPDRKYNGEPVMMIFHSAGTGDSVTLDSIVTVGR